MTIYYLKFRFGVGDF